MWGSAAGYRQRQVHARLAAPHQRRHAPARRHRVDQALKLGQSAETLPVDGHNHITRLQFTGGVDASHISDHQAIVDAQGAALCRGQLAHFDAQTGAIGLRGFRGRTAA